MIDIDSNINIDHFLDFLATFFFGATFFTTFFGAAFFGATFFETFLATFLTGAVNIKIVG